MSMFLCLVHPDGIAISEDICRRYSAKREARTRLPAHWCLSGEFAALVGSDIAGLQPTVATMDPWIAVGTVRLDNREDVIRGGQVDSISDLGAVLLLIRERGLSAIGDCVGDFALVAWNRATRQVVAARDALGARRLFMAQLGGLLAFSTRASLLADGEEYNLEFFAEYILNGHDSEGRTAFTKVAALRAAEIAVCNDGAVRRARYWSPFDAKPASATPAGVIIDGFRELLFDSVRRRLTDEANVWAQLSGGMDSSSLVAVAETLQSSSSVSHGVAGVVTYMTTPAVGSDPEYAALVCEHFGLRQRVLRDWWLWQDDDIGPPLLDQPSTAQSSYAIDRRLTRILEAAGGQVLLCGIGADIYLRPQLDSAADLFARGQLAEAASALATWAGAGRASFWHMLFRHGLYPLLPARARQILARPAWRVPVWIDRQFARRLHLRARTRATRQHIGPLGAKALTAQANRLLSQEMAMPQERMGESNIEWRYPYLHRPLLDYALGLGPEWRSSAGMSKRILREAMRGILPEPVRLRRGKGGLRPQAVKALRMEAARLIPLLRHSILEEFGCIDGRLLGQFVNTCTDHDVEDVATVVNALSLELWLRRRTERWS